MSGSFGDMGNLLRQAQEMQRELDRVQADLARLVVGGSSGGGAVQVEVNGQGEVQRLSISAQAHADCDRAQLEDLVLAALRDGIARAAQARKERLARVTGGLNLPGLF